MNRNPIYDRAKGLGIILVVYGHLFKYGSLPFSIIFSFHMPLFLIISGVLFTPPNWKNIEDRRKWYKKIFVRYTIPFVFFSFLGGFARYIIDGIVNYRVAAKEFLHNIGSDEMMTGALWFIGLLAIAMIILPILLTYDRGKSKRMVFVFFLLTLISYLCDTTRHMSHFPILPFRLRSLSAVVMYLYLGHILKKPIARMIYCSFKFKIIFFVAFPLFFVLACMNQTVNIAVPVYHDLLIYIYCSLYGTIFILLISCHRLPVFIEYIGRQSLFFFAVHAIWITVFVKIVNTYFGTSFKPMIDLPSYMIGVGGVVVVIMSAITTFFVLPVYKKINEFIYSYLNM